MICAAMLSGICQLAGSARRITPRRTHRFDIAVGTFPEGRNPLVLCALGFRVATRHQNLTQLGRLDAGIRQRQVARATKPQFGALAVLRIHENPPAPTVLVDEQVEAAAIRMPTRLRDLCRLHRDPIPPQRMSSLAEFRSPPNYHPPARSDPLGANPSRAPRPLTQLVQPRPTLLDLPPRHRREGGGTG